MIGQEYVMCDGKEPVEMWRGGAGATTIMEFWTIKGYDAGFLIGVDIVAVRIIIGGDKGAGSVYQVANLRVIVMETLRL